MLQNKIPSMIFKNSKNTHPAAVCVLKTEQYSKLGKISDMSYYRATKKIFFGTWRKRSEKLFYFLFAIKLKVDIEQKF